MSLLCYSKPFLLTDLSFRFLESLPESVIPLDKYKQALDSAQSYPLSKQVVSTLPEVHFNVFYYLMAFLRVVLQRETKNKLTAEKLGKEG